MTWLYIFLINWLLNILAIEFLALRKIKPIINVDEARDSKYPAFRRTDIGWFNRPWLYLISKYMQFLKVHLHQRKVLLLMRINVFTTDMMQLW